MYQYKKKRQSLNQASLTKHVKKRGESCHLAETGRKIVVHAIQKGILNLEKGYDLDAIWSEFNGFSEIQLLKKLGEQFNIVIVSIGSILVYLVVYGISRKARWIGAIS